MDHVQIDLNGMAKKPASDSFGIGPKSAASRLVSGQENPDLMLRLPDVLQWLGVSRATLYRWIAASEFPRPVKLSLRTSAWPRRAVAAWLAQREAQVA